MVNPAQATATSVIWNAPRKPWRRRVVRKAKSRPIEAFQSAGPKSGSVEPKVEAAGIEPASEVAP
jgi:hypothetical protein